MSCKVFPPELSQKVRSDPKRRAECNVYDALKSKLKDPKFNVYYSKEWLNKNFFVTKQEDGECDFIIAHPELGLLFIEVKGGPVRKDGQTGQWFSGEYSIKNPIYQARSSKHVFLKALQSQWKGYMPFINAKHCVLLPDSSPNQIYLGEDLPIEIFGFMNDMPNLDRKIYDFYDFEAANSTRVNGKLDDYGMAIISNMLTKNIDFTPRLGETIKNNNFIVEKLTDEQAVILEAASRNSRLLVEGPAGSGKTMLAVKRALVEAHEGKEVLLTCYNKPLVGYLKSKISDLPNNLLINNFHSLCREIVLSSNFLEQSEIDSDPKVFFEEIVQKTFEALEDYHKKFDVIIIDEGQDFEQEWYTLLQLLLTNSNDSKIIVFRDCNQKVRFNKSVAFEEHMMSIMLSKIIRNTRVIAEASLKFYEGDKTSVMGPPGDPIYVKESGNILQQLEKLVKRFINYEGVASSDIAILSFEKIDGSEIGEIRNLNGERVVRSEEIGNSILIDSVSRFKGLEAEVVILYGLPKAKDKAPLLYTAISRARSYLAFIGTPEEIEYVKATI